MTGNRKLRSGTRKSYLVSTKIFESKPRARRRMRRRRRRRRRRKRRRRKRRRRRRRRRRRKGRPRLSYFKDVDKGLRKIKAKNDD